MTGFVLHFLGRVVISAEIQKFGGNQRGGAMHVPLLNKRCAATDREIGPGERYLSILVSTPEGFERIDYLDEAGVLPPTDAFAWWRSRRPTLAEGKLSKTVVRRLLAILEEAITDAGIGSTARELRRWSAATVLLSVKALKLHEVRTEAGRELFVLAKTRGKSLIELVRPQVGDEELKKGEADVVEFANRPTRAA